MEFPPTAVVLWGAINCNLKHVQLQWSSSQPTNSSRGKAAIKTTCPIQDSPKCAVGFLTTQMLWRSPGENRRRLCAYTIYSQLIASLCRQERLRIILSLQCFPVKFGNVFYFSEQSESTKENVKLRYIFFLKIFWNPDLLNLSSVLETWATKWLLLPLVLYVTMSSGLHVNITDYLIKFVFYLKVKKPINVALVLFPVQNLLEATIVILLRLTFKIFQCFSVYGEKK